MKIIRHAAFILFLLLPAFLFAEEGEAPLNLDKIADDLKFNNGREFLKLKRPDKAVEEFNEYLEIYYNGIHRHEVYKELARIYFQRFDYQRAIDRYRSLYEEYSNSDDGVDAYYHIGICYKKMGYDDEAMKIFKSIVSDHPGSNSAYQSRIQVDLLNILAED